MKNSAANFVRMFKPQFASLVESGGKCQTVRSTPKRMPKSGDRISLRQWTGKPYRSKQRSLRESKITGISRIEIGAGGRIVIDGNVPMPTELNSFARADGFSDKESMIQWFEREHGLPFEGIVIYWNGNP